MMPMSRRPTYADSIDFYEQTIKSLSTEKRPGSIRSKKGKMVVKIAKILALHACKNTGLDTKHIVFKNVRYDIPLHSSYVASLTDSHLKKYISRHKEQFFYRLGCDVQCYYEDNFLLAIECKSYTENAMLKRVLVDFSLLKNISPHTKFVLLQLESMLGGDYSDLNNITVGSEASHTIMSYFYDVRLKIITLLEGERDVRKPIHDKRFFKILRPKAIKKAVKDLESLIQSSRHYSRLNTAAPDMR